MMRNQRERNSEPYYDLMEDFDLIVSSFLSQYGYRIYSNDFKSMRWDEFKALLSGLSPDTPLGRIVSIRAEDDPDALKNFTPEQRRIRSEWRLHQADRKTEEDVEHALSEMLNAFRKMAEGSD